MKKNKCPVCYTTSITRLFKATHMHGKADMHGKDIFDYAQCGTCSTIFILNVSFDEKYYKTYYDFGEVVEQQGFRLLLEKFISRYSQKRKHSLLNAYSGKKKKDIQLLDVGCGNGEFLNNLEHQYEGYGIELDKKEFMISKKKGLRVYNEDILTKDFGNKKFDIITLWHVIEHIPESNLLLDKLATLLASDGVLIVATPNIDSMGFSFAKTRWFHFDAPRHVVLFSEEGIKTLSARHAVMLKKVVCETFEFPLDLFWSIKNSTLRMKLAYLLAYPLLKIFSRETLTYILIKKK